MNPLRRGLLRSALLVGCLGLLIPATALAERISTAFRISDDAKMFSKDALEKAEGKIDAIKSKYNKDVLVETFAELPDEAKKDYAAVKGDRQKTTDFWRGFARK